MILIITSIEELIQQLKFKLPEYLAELGINNPTKAFHCLLPTHDDKNSSMVMHRDNMFVRCFGCSQTHSIISLYATLENKPLSGPDFIKETLFPLADKFNMKYSITSSNSEKVALKQSYFRAYRIVADFIKDEANKNPTESFIKELTRRKWKKKESIDYGIGCAQSYKDIKELLVANGFTETFIDLVGLARSDMFNQDSIIFTIYDEFSRPIAFYTRDTKFEEKKAKYESSSSIEINKRQPQKYNSTATFTGIYEKPLTPYGLHDIKNFHKIIIVEGHGCKHNLKLHDVYNVIALGGTSLSDITINKLVSLGVTAFVLMLDNDAPGKNRIKEIVEKYYGRIPIDLFVMDISAFSDVKDPDEFLRKNSIEAFKQLGEQNALEWLAVSELSENSDSYQAIETLSFLIAREKSPIQRLKIERVISEITDIDKDVIHAEVEQKISLSNDRKNEYALRIFDEAKELVSMNPNAISAAINMIESKLGDLDKNSSNNEDLYGSGEVLKGLNQIQDNEESGEITPIIKTGFEEFDDLIQIPSGEAFILVCSQPNSGKCLKWDTEVLMANGSYRNIEYLYNNRIDNEILTMNSNHKIIKTKISDYYDSGVIDTYRLETKDGIFTEPSSVHPYYTLDGWKEVTSLKVGDKIAIPKNYNCFNNIDSDLEEYEASLIGLLLGDGCLTDSVRFTNTNKELIDLFKKCCLKKNINSSFKNYADITIAVVDKTQQINPLRKWLKDLGLFGCKATEKIIPDIIFKSSNKKIALMLGALYACDGWICDRGVKGFELGLGLTNKKLITQVRSLLLRFNIKTSISSKKSSYTKNGTKINLDHLTWTISICNKKSLKIFNENIIIPLKCKQDKITEILNRDNINKVRGSYLDSYPKELWKYINNKLSKQNLSFNLFMKLVYPNRVKIYKEKTGRLKESPYNPKQYCNISHDMLQDINNILKDKFIQSLLNGDIYFDTITKLEYIGKEQCYDLTIDKTHNFVANDMIVHNSTSLINLSLGSMLADENTMSIIHTIDDSRNVYFNRLVALNCDINMNWIKNPNYYLDEDLKKKRRDSYNLISDLVRQEKLIIKDVTHSNSIEYHEKLVRYYRDKYPNRNIVVFCDNFHKLTSEAGYTDSKSKFEYISGRQKSLTTKYGIVEINTVEQKKENMYEKPKDANGIRETGALQYDANLIIYLWNDINARREDAELVFDSKVMEFDPQNGYYYREEKKPIVEWLILKNKLSSFKGSLFFKLHPELARIEPLNRNDVLTMINSNKTPRGESNIVIQTGGRQ